MPAYKKFGSFARLASFSIVWQIINMVTPLIYAWMIMRREGAHIYGSYSTIFAIVAVAMCVSEFGYQSHGIRKIADSEAGEKVKNFWVIVQAKLLLCALIFPFYAIAALWVLKEQASAAMVIVAYSFLIGQAISPLWYLYAERKLGAALYITGVIRLVGTVLLFYTIEKGAGLFWIVANNALTNLAVGLALLFHASALLGKKPTLVSFKEIHSSLIESFPLFLSSASVALYTSLNVIVVNVLLGSAFAGYFSIAERVVKSTQNVFSGLSSSALALTARRAHAETNQFSNIGVLQLQGALLVLSTVIIVGFSKLIVGALGASDTILATQLLRLYSIVLVVGGMSSALNAQVLIAAGRYSDVARVVGIAGVLNLVTIYIFTKVLGVKGSVLSVVSVELFILVATVYMATKMKPEVPKLVV